VLRHLTASVRDVELPRYATIPVVGAEAYAFHAQYFTKTPELYQPVTRRRLQAGSTVTAAAYVEGRRELDRLRRAVGEVFSTVDLLVTPTTPISPVTIKEGVDDPGTPPAGGVALSLRNTQPFDIYGLPSISVPCGFTRSGVPIGLEISGPHLGEPVVLALAHAYEQATDWHRRSPSL
jgi:aspartyl-tRNA(Asn)/glutamyl-tRNA(Gln) amidotransferase subunit A